MGCSRLRVDARMFFSTDWAPAYVHRTGEVLVEVSAPAARRAHGGFEDVAPGSDWPRSSDAGSSGYAWIPPKSVVAEECVARKWRTPAAELMSLGMMMQGVGAALCAWARIWSSLHKQKRPRRHLNER